MLLGGDLAPLMVQPLRNTDALSEPLGGALQAHWHIWLSDTYQYLRAAVWPSLGFLAPVDR